MKPRHIFFQPLFVRRYIYVSFLLVVAGVCFWGLPHTVLAYNASDVLGQGTNESPSYTANSAGGGANAHGLNSPSGVAVDPIGHRLFVWDGSNNRVLVFNLDSTNNIASTSASYVFGQPDFVSTNATTSQSGFGLSAEQPGSLAYDASSSRLFVLDYGNNRVLVFDASTSTIGATTTYGENAEYVFGQTDFVSNNTNLTQSGFFQASALTYDPSSGRLFVGNNNRGVMVFDASTSTIDATTTYGENAEYIFGETDFASTGDAGAPYSASYISNVGGLSYDPSSGRLFVSDPAYARVLVFDASTSTIDATTTYGEDAEYVFGQTSFTSYDGGYGSSIAPNDFAYPMGCSYDPSSGRLFVADNNNGRILVFDASTSTIGATTTYGENPEYVFGQPDFTSDVDYSNPNIYNTVGSPYGITYDPSSSRLFVGDFTNNRVTVFDASTSTIGATTTYGENAESVLGQLNADGTPSFTKTSINGGPYANGFYAPYDTAIDPVGHRLFVSDSWNNRVLVFNLDSTNSIASTSASYVFGQPDFVSNNGTTTAGGLSSPTGLVYDSSSSRLFVADGNNRVLVFDASTSTIGATTTYGENAEYVFGQPDFVSNNGTTTYNGLHYPGGLAYDPSSGRLFVSDYGNNRVLVFDASTSTIGATTTYGEPAEYVFGQTDFVSNVNGSADWGEETTASSLSYPNYLTYDPSSSRLFVADAGNNRVLVFDASTSTIDATTTYGEPAEYVFGQSDFTSYFPSGFYDINSRGFMSPYGLAYDSASSRLFVADAGNNRVLVFDASTSTIDATTTYGENAESVLGQSDFASGSAEASQSGLNNPTGITYDPFFNRLFVADTYNNRVMEYSFVRVIDPELPDGTVGSSYNIKLNTTASQGTVSYSFLSGSLPDGLSFDSSAGVISGTPTTVGSSSFSIEIFDNLSTTGDFSDIMDYTLTVNAASQGVASSTTPVVSSSTPTTTTGSSGSVSSGGGSAYDLSIDGGATSTPTTSVTLSLYGTEAYAMELSDTSSFASSTWIPYVTTMPWTLASETGGQTVSVRFKAVGGSIVGNAEASIDLVPAPVSSTTTTGMTVSQMETLLASLEAQLQALEAEAGTGSASSSSLVFARDLKLGMTGTDVKQLQLFLIAQNVGPAAQKLKIHGATQTFGALTKNALIEFQKHAGITPASGYFGAKTRAYIENLTQ